MKKELVIIKLGGSVITDKSKSRGVFRKKVVARLAKEIFEAKKKKDFDLILIHGAGAYAHYLTSQYRFSEGFLGWQTAWGYAHVKQELFRINNLVWRECLRAGLAVCTVQPSAVIFTRDGEIKSFDTRLVDALLSWGVIPLLMGDDTIDETRKLAILSGDKTMAYLGRKLRASKLIFISDVGGVFDKNPKVYKDAKLIKEITRKNFKSVIDSMRVFNVHDASGEMKGKLLAIKEEFLGKDVQIIGGFKNFAVRDALLGDSSGTRIIL